MKFFKQMTKTEKQDYLIMIGGIAVGLLVVTFVKFLNIQVPGILRFIGFLAYMSLFFLPAQFRQKKQFEKIKQIKAERGISIEEMRKAIDVNQAKLAAWEKGKIFIKPKQWYQLEEYMEQRAAQGQGVIR